MLHFFVADFNNMDMLFDIEGLGSIKLGVSILSDYLVRLSCQINDSLVLSLKKPEHRLSPLPVRPPSGAQIMLPFAS